MSRKNSDCNNLNIPVDVPVDNKLKKFGLELAWHIFTPIAIAFVYWNGKKERDLLQEQFNKKIKILETDYHYPLYIYESPEQDQVNLERKQFKEETVWRKRFEEETRKRKYLEEVAAIQKKQTEEEAMKRRQIEEEEAAKRKRLEEEAVKRKQRFEKEKQNVIKEEEQRAKEALRELNKMEHSIKTVLNIKCSPFASKEQRVPLEKSLTEKTFDSNLSHLKMYDGLKQIMDYDHAHCGGGFEGNGRLYRVWMVYWRSQIENTKDSLINERLQKLLNDPEYINS